MIFVSDASPIISFTLADRLTLLQQIVHELWIPEAVFEELTVEGKPGSGAYTGMGWIRQKADELTFPTRSEFWHPAALMRTLSPFGTISKIGSER